MTAISQDSLHTHWVHLLTVKSGTQTYYCEDPDLTVITDKGVEAPFYPVLIIPVSLCEAETSSVLVPYLNVLYIHTNLLPSLLNCFMSTCYRLRSSERNKPVGHFLNQRLMKEGPTQLMVLGSIRNQAEQANKNMPVSSTLP